MLLKNRSLPLVFLVTFVLFFASATVAVQAGEKALVELTHSTLNLERLSQVHPIECPKPNHSEAQSSHHCCASVCLLKVPYISGLTLADAIPTSLALINQDKAEKAVARIQTLFRPPIA
ncbi:hypothetical protein [Vibrio coralliilyticus]|uniref:DUF2946 domain-containing protein n=1 Tax=Vibrio coralliilyticus TaxID=190893 RepID=A0AAP6ZMH5_9VIBR|nr:hypothetical protein [Vibrio coralliilyticus]